MGDQQQTYDLREEDLEDDPPRPQEVTGIWDWISVPVPFGV
jgi:hypothetical protein